MSEPRHEWAGDVPARRLPILIVEDDASLRHGVAELLAREGYEPLEVADGEAALELLARRGERPVLVVLDLMLPGVDGLTVLRHVRSRWPELAVLVLSARGTVPDKVSLLDAGADDYVVKPFEVAELLARIRALLQRVSRMESRRFRLGDVVVDLTARRVRRDEQNLALSATEFAVLEALLRRAGAVVSRDEIVARVWDLDPPESDRAVDYHILSLRRKLEAEPSRPQCILTDPGLGYHIECEELGDV